MTFHALSLSVTVEFVLLLVFVYALSNLPILKHSIWYLPLACSVSASVLGGTKHEWDWEDDGTTVGLEGGRSARDSASTWTNSESEARLCKYVDGHSSWREAEGGWSVQLVQLDWEF